MNAFHMYWTPSKEERQFKDYYILTLILSAMQWKKTNAGKLTFYADKRTLDFFDKYGLTDLWDECDSDTLDKEIDQEHYDVANFYTIGKFIALRKELCPCALVDTDLVIWNDLQPVLEGRNAAFTHWETSFETPWYCKKEQLSTGPDYKFHDAWDFNSLAANTSFIYFNHDKMKHYYVDCALQYMWDNRVHCPKPENPELIFVEQRLLTMCLDEMNLKNSARPLIDIVWNGQKGEFEYSKDILPHGWKFFDLDNQSIATHTWIAKSMIEKNNKYRTYMCCQAIEIILESDPEMYSVLEKIKPIRKYLKLLEKYQTVKNMVNKHIVLRELYL